MLEYLIQADDGGELWPAVHVRRHEEVLMPRGWNPKTVEGQMDPARADLLVNTISRQIEGETGRPNRVIRL